MRGTGWPAGGTSGEGHPAQALGPWETGREEELWRSLRVDG